MMEKLRKLVGEELGLEEWIPPLGTYTLTYEVVTSLDCKDLRFLLRKRKHTEHLKWESTRKGSIAWDN